MNASHLLGEHIIVSCWYVIRVRSMYSLVKEELRIYEWYRCINSHLSVISHMKDVRFSFFFFFFLNNVSVFTNADLFRKVQN